MRNEKGKKVEQKFYLPRKKKVEKLSGKSYATKEKIFCLLSKKKII